MMSSQQLKRIIEALLFAAGEPLSVAALTESVDELDTRTTKKLLDELADEYTIDLRGFQLVEVQNGFQLTTRPDYSDHVQRLFTKQVSSKLSPAALETLSIVAYHQPVTRSDVEDIRGVSSDGVLNSLIERKMVTIAGRKDVPGRPLLYATTDEFLRHFGLNDLADLPSMDELNQMFSAPLNEEHAA